MAYLPSSTRYDTMLYNRCGLSGIKLPAISLGLWHNFGDVDIFENGRDRHPSAFQNPSSTHLAGNALHGGTL